MCTLSFLPKNDGYIVAMNRDEQLSRPIALPPTIHTSAGSKAIYPLDVEGGTWIAVTESGTTWALLNRNSTLQGKKRRSRGEIILAGLQSAGQLKAIEELRILDEVLPFRLVILSAASRQVREWVWDGQEFACMPHPWQAHHWFSSGRSDAEASEIRGRTFVESAADPSAGSLEWLRKLHRSHDPERGAFSICVHRPDARTVSYTEIQVLHTVVSMSYSAGSPCEAGLPTHIEIPRFSVSLS
jgi:hypothetical protein